VNDHSLDSRPCPDETSDGVGVIVGEQDVGGLAHLRYIVEGEPEDRCEFRRHARRLCIRVEDRDTDLVAARLVGLGVQPGENDDLRR